MKNEKLITPKKNSFIFNLLISKYQFCELDHTTKEATFKMNRIYSKLLITYLTLFRTLLSNAERTTDLIERGKEMVRDGIAGRYDDEFNEIKRLLKYAEDIIAGSSISYSVKDDMKKEARDLE